MSDKKLVDFWSRRTLSNFWVKLGFNFLNQIKKYDYTLRTLLFSCLRFVKPQQENSKPPQWWPLPCHNNLYSILPKLFLAHCSKNKSYPIISTVLCRSDLYILII